MRFVLVEFPFQYDTISFPLVCVRYLIGTLSIIHISLSRFPRRVTFRRPFEHLKFGYPGWKREISGPRPLSGARDNTYNSW